MRIYALFWLTSTISLAESITGITTCRATIPDSAGQRLDLVTTSLGSCSIPLGDPRNQAVSAAANGSFTLSSTPEGFNTLVLHTDTQTPLAVFGITYPGSDMIFYIRSGVSASASVSDTQMLATTGSVRSGLLEYQGSLRSTDFFRMGIGAFSGFALGPIEFGPGPGPIGFIPIRPMIVPWTLGMPFTLNSYSHSEGFQVGVDEPGSTFSDLSLQFRFFESDGTTPVPVIPVPEPSSMLAYAVALAIGAMTVKRTQR